MFDHVGTIAIDTALRALPQLEPPRSVWPQLAVKLRPRRRWLPRLLTASAAAALATLALLPRTIDQPPPAAVHAALSTPSAARELAELMQASAQLETMIGLLGSDSARRVGDLALRDELNIRVQRVDLLLAEASDAEAAWLLWRRRVALLEQVLDVSTDAPWLATLSEAPSGFAVSL